MKQSEHRHAARKSLSLPAAYSYHAGAWPTLAVDVLVLNLSEGGALIKSKTPLRLRPDDVVSITLSLDEGNVTVEGRVARVASQADGSCDAGVAFRNLSAEDVYALELQLMKKAP